VSEQSWNDFGRPANWTPEIAETLNLVRELYRIHAVGGPLHVVLDDWNIDAATIEPYYDCYGNDDLDAPYYDGWKIADLDPGAPAVVEGIGRSMRQLCDDIAAKLTAMSIEDRASVLAYHWRLVPVPSGGES
jgi:hypothetical protein